VAAARRSRELIRLRRSLPRDFRLLQAGPGVLAFARGAHTVAINTTDRPLPVPRGAEVVLETHPGGLRDDELAPHAGAISRN
jgi:hypothetical protein